MFDGMYVADPLAVLLNCCASCYSRWRCCTRALPGAPRILHGEYYVLVADRAARHLGDGLGPEPPDGLPRRGAAVAVAVRHGGLRPRFGRRSRGGDEVLRARRDRFRHAALRHVDLYGVTGTLDSTTWRAKGAGEPALGLVLGIVFIVVGIAFKFGAVPFHMWLPDVYHGAPDRGDIVRGHRAEDRLVRDGVPPAGGRPGHAWTPRWQDMLGARGAVVVVGNLVAIAQTNLKRMLAYSTIAQRRLHPVRLRRRHRRRLRSGAVTR